jgi:hypothetical protein
MVLTRAAGGAEGTGSRRGCRPPGYALSLPTVAAVHMRKSCAFRKAGSHLTDLSSLPGTRCKAVIADKLRVEMVRWERCFPVIANDE